LHERRTEAPLLDVAILASPRVLLPNLGSGLAGYAAFGAFFLIPRLVQAPRHLPAAVAGQVHYGFDAGVMAVCLYLLPLALGIVCAGPGGSTIGRRFGGKYPFVGGLALVTLACALTMFFHANRFALAAWLFLLGAGFAMSIGAGNVFVSEAVEPGQTGIAVSFNSLMRLIFGGIGAQIAAMLLLSHSIGHSHTPRESAFVIAFGIAAALAFVGVIVGLLVPGNKH
jgi:MFS family permease